MELWEIVKRGLNSLGGTKGSSRGKKEKAIKRQGKAKHGKGKGEEARAFSVFWTFQCDSNAHLFI